MVRSTRTRFRHYFSFPRLRSGFRLQASAALTPAKRLNFKTGDRHLRCQWCVRLAHASAITSRSLDCARDFGLLRLTNGKLRFDEAMVPMGQQPQTQRNAEQRRQHEPTGAAEVNVLPVLRDDDGGDRDGNEYRQGSCNVYWNAESQEGNSNEGFPKSKYGPNRRGKKDNEQNIDSSAIHSTLAQRAEVIASLNSRRIRV